MSESDTGSHFRRKDFRHTNRFDNDGFTQDIWLEKIREWKLNFL